MLLTHKAHRAMLCSNLLSVGVFWSTPACLRQAWLTKAPLTKLLLNCLRLQLSHCFLYLLLSVQLLFNKDAGK